MRFSVKAQSISPSVTLAISAKAAEMKAEGKDLIGFGAGEPDFDTPDYIKDAAKEALDKGLTKYTPAAGTKELRQAVADRLKRKYGLDYDFRDIVISNGAKHSLFNVFQAVLNPGDEVIVIGPYWVTYPELIKMADGVPVFVEGQEENNFEPDMAEVEAAVTERTAAIVVTNPSNPCGCIYSKATLEAIAVFAEKYDLHVIADEIYDELVYDGEFISFPTLSEDAKNRTILVNGLSKTYSMTGWRLGYTASKGPAAGIMGSYQSHAASNACSITQYAAAAALNGPQEELARMVAEFKSRRDFITGLINGIDGLSCISPQGAFYVMMNISALKGKKVDGEEITDSMSFASLLLDKVHVAVVPGVAFGSDDHVRLSYAISRENIKEGLRRIAEFVKMTE